MLEIEYPMDLNLIKSRLDNQFYRRTTAIQVVSFRLQRNLLHLSFRCNCLVLTTYTTDSEWCMFLFLYKPCYTRVSNNVFLFVRYFATMRFASTFLQFHVRFIAINAFYCYMILSFYVRYIVTHAECYMFLVVLFPRHYQQRVVPQYICCSLMCATLPPTRNVTTGRRPTSSRTPGLSPISS